MPHYFSLISSSDVLLILGLVVLFALGAMLNVAHIVHGVGCSMGILVAVVVVLIVCILMRDKLGVVVTNVTSWFRSR